MTALAEINVTPFVDVMLVLLIVFMVSAPLMQQGVQVHLPKANAGSMDDVPDQLNLMISKDQTIAFNGKALKKGTLRERLLAISAAKPGVQVVVQADKDVAYGFIAQVISEVKNAKISRVGLKTAPADKNFHL
ncbi:MAG: ExbD/TolR family protein [Bacteriovoracia bacterium]